MFSLYICTLHYHAMLEGPENALTLKYDGPHGPPLASARLLNVFVHSNDLLAPPHTPHALYVPPFAPRVRGVVPSSLSPPAPPRSRPGPRAPRGTATWASTSPRLKRGDRRASCTCRRAPRGSCRMLSCFHPCRASPSSGPTRTARPRTSTPLARTPRAANPTPSTGTACARPAPWGASAKPWRMSAARAWAAPRASTRPALGVSTRPSGDSGATSTRAPRRRTRTPTWYARRAFSPAPRAPRGGTATSITRTAAGALNGPPRNSSSASAAPPAHTAPWLARTAARAPATTSPTPYSPLSASTAATTWWLAPKESTQWGAPHRRRRTAKIARRVTTWTSPHMLARPARNATQPGTRTTRWWGRARASSLLAPTACTCQRRPRATGLRAPHPSAPNARQGSTTI